MGLPGDVPIAFQTINERRDVPWRDAERQSEILHQLGATVVQRRENT